MGPGCGTSESTLCTRTRVVRDAGVFLQVVPGVEARVGQIVVGLHGGDGAVVLEADFGVESAGRRRRGGEVVLAVVHVLDGPAYAGAPVWRPV